MHKDKQPDFICSLLNGLNGNRATDEVAGFTRKMRVGRDLSLLEYSQRIRNACAHNSFFTLDYNKMSATALRQWQSIYIYIAVDVAVDVVK